MTNFERVLAADSRELPDCRCGAEMPLVNVVPVPRGSSEVRIFHCSACNHELRLTVWLDDLSAT
jgi:hypothetical protein